MAAADGTGRPLFCGLAGQLWPQGPVSHVAACVVRGLGPVEMNVPTELWVGMAPRELHGDPRCVAAGASPPDVFKRATG